MIGQTLGSFQVLAKLGEGGMGEVYLAMDARLDRRVAVKALPEHLTTDPDRLARFEREAKVMASLNHPNVGAIHGVEQAGDRRYLVLEFVDGETLARRLARGPIPPDEALRLARQIADGLEAAHQKGIIHRDLKPGNIMIAGEDQIKVLDFGLARTVDPDRASTADSPTVISPAPAASPTVAGVILGTVGYMSPEQARGKPLDRRSDVFAFGCVLYEMLTGSGPFAGETVADSLGAILHREPDWSRLPPGIPPLLRLLLVRCLAKDKRERLQDIGDARLLIDEALTARNGVATSAPAGRRALRFLWPGIAAAAALVAAWSFMRPTEPATPARPIRSQIELPPGFTLSSRDTSLALSPDGTTLAVTGGPDGGPTQLWVRPLDSRTLQPLVGTDGAHIPFWSPDGREIAFFGDGSLKRIPAGGGTVTRIAPAPDPRGGTWGPDNVIVFSPGAFGPLMRVAADGGTATAITSIEPGKTNDSHRWPQFLADGRTVLYYDQRAAKVRTVDLATGREADVIDVPSQGVFAAPDRLLFIRGSDLTARFFDPAAGVVGSDETLVAPNVRFDPLRGAGKFTTSPDGTVVYFEAEFPTTRLEWFDRSGRSLGEVGEPNPYSALTLSPDGARLAAGMRRPDGRTDLWVFDTTRGLGSKIDEDVPVPIAAWSPDGTRLAYIGSAPSGRVLRVRHIDGQGTDTNSAVSDHWAWVSDWSRDGRHLVVTAQHPQTNYDLLLTTATGDAHRNASVLKDSPADELMGQLSPDGRWLVYVSRQRGASQIEVVPTSPSGPSRPVARVPGEAVLAAWLDDWSVVYVDADSRVFAVSLRFEKDGTGPVVGPPVPLAGSAQEPVTECAITRDGQRALCRVPAGESASPRPSLTLIQNWRRAR
jgi:Tol biopolymer transport system component